MYDLKTLSKAIFVKPYSMVVEAYSEYGQFPRNFYNDTELVEYMESKLSSPGAYVHLFVVYEDMMGRVERRRIELDSKKVDGHTHRYTWDGWGMISVQLHPDRTELSGVTSNSESRAKRWSSTQPEFGAVEEWNWDKVVSHTRRLQRVLNKIT